MLKEFKEFIQKGNAIQLAIGFVMGAAFTAIVTSLVNDLIMPILGLVLSGADFSNKFIAMDGGDYATLVEAQEAGAATLAYGNFINAIISFIIIAFILFLIVKGLNSMRKAEEAEEEVTTKECPHCLSQVPLAATRCPQCTSQLEV
ncbi:MAG: large conductance mechanosensitive channel protein MscL [Tissierellia bacterium]|nr:large conductance mechanosensitive channel protein MscL [Tissierellia bacterium]